MDGRTLYRTLLPKRTPFQTGIDNDPTCERCLEKDDWATHILCDCEAIAYLIFRHMGQYFMEPSDHYDAPINKVLHFIRNVGLIKRESTIDHWWSRCKVLIIMAHPLCIHARIHSFIHSFSLNKKCFEHKSHMLLGITSSCHMSTYFPKMNHLCANREVQLEQRVNKGYNFK
jgi:hypothetical protein